MPRRIVGTEEFMGLQTDVERSERQGSQKDQNANRLVRGAWKVRSGLADTGLSDGANRIDSVGWGRCETGNFLLYQDSAGSLFGAAIPVPTWTSA
jgi:hypothetical protein